MSDAADPQGIPSVRAMFGRIATRYDLMNRVLSGRRDVAWRRAAVGMLRSGHGAALDLACGTFDLALEVLAQRKAMKVHGGDFCQPMLEAGAAKRVGYPLTASVADALRLPYADASFDLALCAYGWRNFGNPLRSAQELRRVLTPGGEVLILEFFRPTTWWPKCFYGTFGRFVFPIVGGLIAQDREAYRYLHDSVKGFISTDEATAALREAGFTEIRWRSFFGGVSHAVLAQAPR